MNMDDMNNRMYDTHIILGHMGARAVRGVTMHAQRRSYYLSVNEKVLTNFNYHTHTHPHTRHLLRTNTDRQAQTDPNTRTHTRKEHTILTHRQ